MSARNRLFILVLLCLAESQVTVADDYGQSVKLGRPVAIKHHLRGYGAQFDCELFTKNGQPRGCTKAQLDDLKQLVNRLKPGHSRIFVTGEVLQPPKPGEENEEREALKKTIVMARESGANVNLTWWSGPQVGLVGDGVVAVHHRWGGVIGVHVPVLTTALRSPGGTGDGAQAGDRYLSHQLTSV